MAREDRAIGGRLLVVLLLLVCAATRCEARAARRLRSERGGSNPLLNALFKLNFIRAVEPPARPLPPPADGDAASLADAGGNAPFCVNPPDAPPATTTSPFGGSTPSAPDQPLPQPPPLPPVAPAPPSFEPSPPVNGGTPTPGQGGGQGGGGQGQESPPDNGGTPTPGQGGQGGGQGGGGQGQEGPPASATPNPPPLFGPSTPAGMAPPSPIVVVPSPPDFGPGGPGSGGGPFQPPIVYPPPLAPPLLPGAGKPVWCVAKPTVPDPIIQEAMDYACGSGAECSSIQPSGACYHPNTVLAHASFAFNSYWQQTKSAGGTCDFGGTATIVTRDPSYEKCKFDLL